MGFWQLCVLARNDTSALGVKRLIRQAQHATISTLRTVLEGLKRH